MDNMTSDEYYMREALELAKKGLGRTSPNPAVGCVIVKGGKIVGRGWHKKAGGPHAEIIALAEASETSSGATMYVTLEPCCCYGKTPPCTKAIIAAGVAKVVAAMEDPNHLVSGKGLAELKRAGVEVTSGLLEAEAKKLNEAFAKYIKTKTPFVIVKAALSLDGRLADRRGNSKWISGPESKQMVHELRNAVDAIMVGANTIIKDDPLLTCRISDGRNPMRVVVDSILKVPEKAKVFNTEAKTIVFTTKKASKKKLDGLRKRGVAVVTFSQAKIDLRKTMAELGARGITSVMIEGGGQLIGSAFEANVVDKVMFFIAPKIIGDGVTIQTGGANIKDAIQLERVEVSKVGEDFLITGYVKNR